MRQVVNGDDGDDSVQGLKKETSDDKRLKLRPRFADNATGHRRILSKSRD